MVRYEKEILDYVQTHPGCSNFDLIKGVHGVLVGVDADQMVVNGKLDCWYTKKEPTYYIPGAYTPPHLIEIEAKTMTNEVQQLQYEKRDSIEVTRNAKGEYGWKVKQYYNSPDQQIDIIVADLKETDKQLREAFL